MIQLFKIFFFLILLCSFISAQETISSCPTVEVKGETNVVQPGGTMSFTAVINGDLQKSSLKFHWTIDQGTIIEGQGETILIVDTTGLEDTTISAVLEVIGLPENCYNSATVTNVVGGTIGCGLPAFSYGKIPLEEEFLLLDIAYIMLDRSPELLIYIEITLEKDQTLESGKHPNKISLD